MLDRTPAPSTYAIWIAEHARAFEGVPVKRHVVVWETTVAADAQPYDGPLERERERSTVLTIRRPPIREAPFTMRELVSDGDWNDAAALDATHWSSLGDDFAAFGRWCSGVVRRDAAAGRCRVWGARDGDELVAFAGMYASEEWARFITPVTAPAYRRRGIFSALASIAIAATLRTHPDATVVIAAEAGSAPERTYLCLGFEPVGELRALVAGVVHAI